MHPRLSSPHGRHGVITLLFALIVAGLFVSDRQFEQSRVLPNAPASRLQCVSYTPSHNARMQGPAAVRKLVRQDLALLARNFRCIRTYSVSEGLDEVPAIARELGLTVMLGLWISADAKSNAAEIAHGIELANRHQDVVSAVIVGNEVLLRRELAAPQLRALIEQVRAATSVPVTYADVWEFWLRNPELATAASFVTVHILPYWEDQPIDINHALDHIKNIYGKVQAAFPGRQIFIGETGWPSAGRPRLGSTPTLENEARFIREFVVYAEENRIEYNLIEAFDQPWKRIQEGTVGGYWGLFDADGEPKFALTGPIATTTRSTSLIAAFIGATAFALLGWLCKPRLTLIARGLLLLAGFCAGVLVTEQWRYMSTANRDWLEWTVASIWASAGWLAFALACVDVARWSDGHELRRLPGIAVLMRAIGHDARSTEHYGARLLGALRFMVMSGVAYVCLGLAFDGRGRDFPVSLFALPVIALALRDAVSQHAPQMELEREELLLGVALLISNGVTLYIETFANMRAVMWCALGLTLAISPLASNLIFMLRWAHPRQRTQQQPDAA